VNSEAKKSARKQMKIERYSTSAADTSRNLAEGASLGCHHITTFVAGNFNFFTFFDFDLNFMQYTV
jgi:hypothetical protein